MHNIAVRLLDIKYHIMYMYISAVRADLMKRYNSRVRLGIIPTVSGIK